MLNMVATKKSIAVPAAVRARKKRVPEQDIGPDGRTLSQRVIMLMTDRGIGQTELARLCSDYYATFVPGEDDKVKQQHIFNLIRGQSSAWALPLIAAVFDVSDLWLQFGIGKKERPLKN